MEEILINWLSDYTGTIVTKSTKFSELNFDLYDEAVVCHWVKQKFNANINLNNRWYETVEELCNNIKYE